MSKVSPLDILKNRSPRNLFRNALEQDKIIQQLQTKNVEGDDLSEIAPDGGALGATDFGALVVDGDGVHTDANLLDINWWLPLNLASDVLTAILDFVYDGTEYIYVAGTIQKIGGQIGTSNYVVARYSLITRNWAVIGSAQNTIEAIAYYSGTLYVGGSFTDINSVANTAYIASWNGSVWSALGTGANGQVQTLVVDSTGILYAGGFFTLMGGVANTVRIAKWSAGAWTALGTGAATNRVLALAVDASNNLYAGGTFSGMGGVASTAFIAKWSGAWSSIGVFGNGVYGFYYDSNLNYLYTGGSFTTITGYTDVVRVAYYDGTIWNALGTGIDNGTVYCVTVDSSGNPVIGGNFTNAGGDALADRIARCENGVWSALSNGGGASGLDGIVYALLGLSNGSILAGGSFDYAGSIQCQSIALYCKPLSDAIDIIASLFELYAPSEGTYTPTLFNTTNIAASTAYVTAYYRLGNIVTVFGAVDVDPTAATQTVLGMSLPIATVFVNEFELGGTGVVSDSAAARRAVSISADVANQRAFLAWFAVDGVNRTIRFHFSYRVLPA